MFGWTREWRSLIAMARCKLISHSQKFAFWPLGRLVPEGSDRILQRKPMLAPPSRLLIDLQLDLDLVLVARLQVMKPLSR